MLRLFRGSEIQRLFAARLPLPNEVEKMFLNRAQEFAGRHGWKVKVDERGYEIDEFDEKHNPLYVVALDDAGEYVGSLRLLPTLGATMLGNVEDFRSLLTDEEFESVVGVTIWESSRICSVKGRRSRANGGVLGELLAGINEIAILEELTQIVSVFDERLFRVLQRVGCELEIIGEPQVIGETLCLVGLFPVGESQVERIRSRLGITESVLAPEFRKRC